METALNAQKDSILQKMGTALRSVVYVENGIIILDNVQPVIKDILYNQESVKRRHYQSLALLTYTVQNGIMTNVKDVHNGHTLVQLVFVFLLVITAELGTILMDSAFPVIKDINLTMVSAFNQKLIRKVLQI